MPFIVPPGGFAGFSQMTPASRAALSPRGGVGPRSYRKTRRKSTKARKRRAGGARKGRLPKFGSPAWRKKFKLGGKRKR